MTITTIIRWTLTLILLIVVWRHSHWSVALCVTLLALNEEVEAWLIKKILKTIKEFV